MESGYNLRSPAVKRLMKEAQELREPTEQFYAQPLDDNLFEWHFTIRGPAETEFEGGIYHGRIILPPEYPMKPPSIILLTPNGRFETNKKICLSISGHHPESWQPSWSLRTALLAIIGFMPTHGNGAIGSLDYTADERKAFAKKSQDWKCPQCGAVQKLVLPVTEASKALNKEAKELGSQINLQGEKEKSPSAPSSEPDAGSTDASAATGEQAAGAAGPVPLLPSETVPSLPGFPYPMNPQLMFGTAARYPTTMNPNPLGVNPFTPMMPVGMPPPFFFPNMMYNPLMMQPRPPGPYPTAPLPGFPPGFPMPGWWMGPSQYQQSGAATAAGMANPLGSSTPSFGTGQSGTMPGTSGTVPGASGTVPGTLGTVPGASGAVPESSTKPSVVPSTVNVPGPFQQPTSAQSTSPSVPSLVQSSPALQPSTLESNITATSTSATTQSSPNAAEVHASDAQQPSFAPDDPVPSANELRQRSVAREQQEPPVVRRTNQPAEISHHQRSLSADISRMLLNFLVGVLILCIIALLSRRLYLLG